MQGVQVTRSVIARSEMTKQSQADPQRNMVTIGRILKPRGLSGEVKCQVLTNITEAFSQAVNIEKISYSGGFAFVKFKGVDSIEAADAIRGKLIQIPRESLPLNEGEVIADDLIGFEVVGSNGKKLGTIRAIESVGASEVFDLGHIMIPNEDVFILETNMRTKQITVDETMLEEETVL